MSDQQYTNCIRCGKQRIFFKRWKEKGDGRGTPVIMEQTVCPDPECQKIVDQKFQEIRDRREQAEERKRNLTLRKPAKVVLAK